MVTRASCRAALSTAKERWRRTWGYLGIEPPDHPLGELAARYLEPHRHYHDLRHVLDCLEEAAGCRELQERPALVDLALWYHDVVYDPRRGDNETKSAELAAAALDGLVPARDMEAVEEMILDTRHDRPPRSADGAVVVDIDLSILGAEHDRFEAYRSAIRREYSWVPMPLYRRRRKEVLEAFLGRPLLFRTPLFRERYEARARANLEAELRSL
jgi:predicted metal-dependent HD superfamily phosphohydrolase